MKNHTTYQRVTGNGSGIGRCHHLSPGVTGCHHPVVTPFRATFR